MNKYTGSQIRSRDFIFSLPEVRRTVSILVTLATKTEIQYNPLLAALSMLHTYDDIDEIYIDVPSVTAIDLTPFEEPFRFKSILVTRDKLFLCVSNNDDLFDDDDDATLCDLIELPRHAFLMDMVAMLAEVDETIISPPPLEPVIVEQEYTDEDGDVWDGTLDPMRTQSEGCTLGNGHRGWIEDVFGMKYYYVDYHDFNDGLSDDGIELADAEIPFIAVRGEDVDDGKVSIMVTDDVTLDELSKRCLRPTL